MARAHRLSPPFWLRIALGLATSCGGAEPTTGLDFAMRIEGAQAVSGDMPRGGDGPPITFVGVTTNTVAPGEAGKLLSGRARKGSFALQIGLEGDRGYWIVPSGLEDPTVPGELAWSARLDFSRSLSLGEHTVKIQATDTAGTPGAPDGVVLLAARTAPVDGELVVSLDWDRNADVDLHVVDPNGVDISPKNINAYEPPPPGSPPDDPDAWQSGGQLDQDSNANCVIDGRRSENVVWTEAPPAGAYFVLVDLFSACDAPVTSYTIEVWRKSELLSRHVGRLYPKDAEQHPSGDGVAPGFYVTEFTIP